LKNSYQCFFRKSSEKFLKSIDKLAKSGIMILEALMTRTCKGVSVTAFFVLCIGGFSCTHA